MMIMMSANSMLTMYLGLETLALSMYALVAIDRNNVTSAESAMKYFVLGAIASGCSVVRHFLGLRRDGQHAVR